MVSGGCFLIRRGRRLVVVCLQPNLSFQSSPFRLYDTSGTTEDYTEVGATGPFLRGRKDKGLSISLL